MKILVQAGGLGTRMEYLTHCKPKALIPVRNRPILFQLLDIFNAEEDEFVVIGDYKYDVLDSYLTTFQKSRSVILVKSSFKGNVAGIKEALKYFPDNEPILIVWSDLLLPKDLKEQIKSLKIEQGAAVGTVDFPCSWRMSDGHLVHSKGDKNGVAGLYYFSSKALLNNLSEAGSFTTWLSTQDFPLINFPIRGCEDVGTLSAYRSVEDRKFRCRPYNKITINADTVIKEGLTSEAVTFIKREIDWYKKALEFGIENIPQLIKDSPLTLTRIHGENVFDAKLSIVQKRLVFGNIVEALERMHSYGTEPANSWDLYFEYFVKTLNRVRSIAPVLPFNNQKLIKINGIACHNILNNVELFRRCILSTLMSSRFAFYHGDCQLTNTLVDGAGKVYFIDPRGYFGKTKIIGDVRYDWAKLYFAIFGNFDQFNVKNFKLTIHDDSVEFEIGSSGWEFLAQELFSSIPKEEGNQKEIELIHSIVWLSLASHAWEDFDSMVVAFCNGTLLFEKWIQKYYE